MHWILSAGAPGSKPLGGTKADSSSSFQGKSNEYQELPMILQSLSSGSAVLKQLNS